MSLRGRVFAYLALAAVASCLLTVAVAVVLVRHRLESQRTAALSTQADNLASVGAPAGVYRARVIAGRTRLVHVPARRAAAILAHVPRGGAAQGSLQGGGLDLLYVRRGAIVLIGSARIAFAQWRPFLVSIVIAGAGGVLLAAVLALALARRLTRPVSALAHATRRLAAGEPDVEVPAAGDDELGQLARSFNRMAAELARARAGQRTFLESVSHELRTPLTSIRGYAEALEEGAVATPDAARVIGAEAGRLERLVADLLELARLGRSEFSARAEPVELTTLAGRAIERHRPAATTLGVALTCATDGLAPARGDPDRILQAVSNLIENALRLTPSGGTITVCCAPGEIAVRDTGPGIAAEDLPRAFERFHLHGRYRSERPVGSGLGLAIVAELARAMGGRVHARPAPGGGAEFVLALPAPDAMPERSATPDGRRPSA